MSELFYEHVIENDNIDQILKLNVNEYFYAEDKNKKNVIHGKILLDNKYLSIGIILPSNEGVLFV